MKKSALVMLVLLLLACSVALAEGSDSWREAPVITKAYELSSGKLYIEWEGNAPVYQVYMDGRSVANVIVNNAVIDVKKGTHTILVYPISEAKAADTKIDFQLDATIVGGSVGIDLAALGLDPKNLAAGDPSNPLYVDYTPSPIFSAAPSDVVAVTDFQDCVVLSFSDRYYADEYVIAIKVGKDTSYVRFNVLSPEADEYLSKAGSTVSIVLAPEYLRENECIVPELDVKYTFTVQLRKYAKNLVDGGRVERVVHESKTSKGYQYTPVAAWKTAPVIVYASQTADGQITLRWAHDDNDIGCEYAVMKVKKTLGIRSGLQEVAVVNGDSCVIHDLMNGGHSYVVVPRYAGVEGDESESVTVDVKNDWVVAPELRCEQTGSNTVTLSWDAAEGIVSYHIVVSTGDHTSLLRYVNLDYSKHSEYDVPVSGDSMTFVFEYDSDIDTEAGEKIKFEVYGVRYTAKGDEQKTATTTQTITIKVLESEAE